ncbi:aminotransferase-like domain-containing protein [Streptomyces avermitilis]|uniref:aminotransferase-like domain-containing protein n=1 Tax=Streptomyces avermitilis TaxID=33903 RepID=UPI0038193466
MRRISPPELSGLLGAWSAGTGTLPKRLARSIETAILNGRLPLGVRLPAERLLAQDLQVARGTVAAAYDHLRATDLIITRAGSGSVTALPPRLRDRLAPWSTDFGEEGRRGAVLDLTIAEPTAPFAELHMAVRAAAENLHAALLSEDRSGCGQKELREAIAARYSSQGLPTRAEDILMTSGADAALDLVSAVYLRHGHRVIVDSPTYPRALSTLRAAGARLIGQPLGPLGWDLETLERTLSTSHAALAYLVPDFHNPTGLLMSEEQRSKLRNRISQHDTLFIIDETMRDLDLRTAPQPPSHIASAAISRHVITIGSLSKTLWPGLRVGWIRAHRQTVTELSRAAITSSLVPPVLDQLTAIQLLEHFDDILAFRLNLLREQRNHLATLLSNLHWARSETPIGGLTFWLELLDTNSTRLANHAAAHDLRLSPGFQFSPDGVLDQYLRIPFTLTSEALDKVVERLINAHADLSPATHSG